MKTLFLFILSTILLVLSIYLGFRVYRLNQFMNGIENLPPTIISKTDTVFIDKPIEVVKYKERLIPERVIIYKDMMVDEDSLMKCFIDSLLGLELKNNQISLSFLKNDSVYSKELYRINLDKYKYSYSNGVMTYTKNRRLNLYPFIEASIRPFNNLYDLSGGILFETTRLNYKLSLNSSYYPKFNNKPNLDLEATITYKFKK